MNDDFTLEKLKIAQQLQDLKTEVVLTSERTKVLTEKLDIHIDFMRGTISEHDKLLKGNGTPGFIIRMDRIEQIIAGIKWLWMTVASLIVYHVWKIIVK